MAAIDVRERCFSVDLVVEGGRCVGVRAIDADGPPVELRARHTMLATGGAGQLFSVTTNPPVSTGDGIAMALRAGVAVADVEFMQFHPTAMDHPSMPRPLLSEALRGEGAVLRDEHGVRFMVDEDPRADLAPRDIVARAIARRLVARGLDHLWLDATGIADFPDKFPTIASPAWRSARTRTRPRVDFLPVAPAAHYLSGGIVADLDGASTLPGLWSCGEAACSGVHGANRLASNSLLDGLVFAPRIVEAILAGKDAPEPTGVMRGVDADAAVRGRRRRPPVGAITREELQHAMTVGAGVLRDAASLEAVAATVAVDVDARDVADPRGAQPARGGAGARGVGPRPRGESGHAHPPRLPRDVRGASPGGSSTRGRTARVRPAPGRGAGVSGDARDYDPPAAGLRELVARALVEDFGSLGDLTSIATIPEDATGAADIVARRYGVLAGVAAATEVFAQVDPTRRARVARRRRRDRRARSAARRR